MLLILVGILDTLILLVYSKELLNSILIMSKGLDLMYSQVRLCLVILVHVLVFVLLLDPLQLLLQSLLSLLVTPVKGISTDDFKEFSEQISRCFLILLDQGD